MAIQRRLLHCSRCLRAESTNAFNFPSPSRPEPLSPPNPSVASNLPRVSLSAATVRKVPARQWIRDNAHSTGNKPHNPLAKYALQKEPGQKEPQDFIFYRDPAKEKLKEGLRRGLTRSAPMAAPHAVHGVVSPVPKSFTASDVVRLVPYDRTKHTMHPLVEATRIYDEHLWEQTSYLLRFLHPSHLQDFLAQIPDIQIYNQKLMAKLFSEDIDPKHRRPGTALSKGATPTNILRHREQYFRDFSGKSSLVMVTGIPSTATLGMMTYMIHVIMGNEKFDWAHEWKNRPGSGEQFESNAVPLPSGRQGFTYARWVFMLRDKESAWRFARRMHLSHFREDKFGKNFVLNARVMD